MQQLGVILTPYGANSPHGWYAEITGARGGNGTYLSQPGGFPRVDHFHHTRGEPGFYYDTQLGSWQEPKTKIGAKFKGWWMRMFGAPATAAPGVLPQGGGMTPSDAELAINTQCYTPVASGWTNTQTGFVPGTWRFGWNAAGSYGPPSSLGDAGADLISVTNAHNDRMFKLAIVSTAAVSISAMFTLWTRYKRLKNDLVRKRR
jgi:hypothetical protein